MALVNPTTRAALSGMLTGKVDREWGAPPLPEMDAIGSPRSGMSAAIRELLARPGG